MESRRWVIVTTLTAAAGAGILLVLVILFIRSNSFLSLFPDPFLQVQDYPFNLRDNGCQIVIYGDSTGMTGYDPTLIEARTGLRTCNISQTKSILAVNGTLPLDAYLRNNPHPRYLVLQASPDSYFRDQDWDRMLDTDPITEMVRHRFDFKTALNLALHSRQSSAYFYHLFRVMIRPEAAMPSSFRTLYAPVVEQFYKSRGLIMLPKPSETACENKLRKIEANLDRAWIEELRKRYTAQGMRVLVNSSPVPDCDPLLGFYRRALTPVLDGKVSSFPIYFFNDSDRHFAPRGVVRASQTLAEQIRARESKPRSQVTPP